MAGTVDSDMARRQRARIHARTTVFAVVAAQLVTGVALCGVFAAGGDSRAAYSVLTGTLCGAVPNFYLALKMFSIAHGAPPDRLLRAIYVGETLKIVFAAAMLAVTAVFLDVSVPFVIGGYLVTVMVQWFALLMPVTDGAAGRGHGEG
jgi:ATP synthase protein I